MGVTSHDVIIIGGGAAGITVASRLRKKQPKLDIAIIEPSQKHYYQPLWTLVGAGVFRKEVTERSEASLIPRGVKWIVESADSIDPENRTVTTLGRNTYRYENLVVAAGLQVDWDRVKGLPETVGKNGVCSIYDYRYVASTWEMISGFKGGNALFTFPNTPVKCGGAPQKIMYLADHHFRRSGVRDRTHVMFVSAGGSIFGVKKYAEALSKVILRRHIQTDYKLNLVEVRPRKREAIFENVETKSRRAISYDLLHVTPPMSGPDFLKRGPLTNASGWVEVNKNTLQHVKYPDVFALGDASSLPTSKTGAAIRHQAPVLIENLMCHRGSRKLSASYDGYTSCPLVTGYGSLILAEFDYDGNPKETFPWDQSKERLSMYLLKKHLLPRLYWHGMLRGRA